MAKKAEINQSATIETVSLYETAQQRYLNYALSVITSRALPDVRDGMKPVQRRILYGMHEMRLTHEAKHQKSAQVVGQVMGRYHPHGDSSIYGALVRLSQDWVMRYPLIDFHGSNGNRDGDGPAAYRYTEARLAKITEDGLLAGIKKNNVGFILVVGKFKAHFGKHTLDLLAVGYILLAAVCAHKRLGYIAHSAYLHNCRHICRI